MITDRPETKPARHIYLFNPEDMARLRKGDKLKAVFKEYEGKMLNLSFCDLRTDGNKKVYSFIKKEQLGNTAAYILIISDETKIEYSSKGYILLDHKDTKKEIVTQAGSAEKFRRLKTIDDMVAE